MSDDRRPSPSPRSTPSSPPRTSPRAPTERHPALRPRPDEAEAEEARLFAETARAHDEWQKRQSQNKPSPSGAPGKPSASGKPYVRKKKPRTLGSRLRGFAFWVVLPCSIVAGGAWAMTSPAWKISAVDIQGAPSTPRAMVEPIAHEMMRQNWLRADLSAARSRLAKLPTVQAATVAREWNAWPPRLRVEVQERTPWIRLGGGATWWVVDRAGIAFRRANKEDRALYPITSTAFDPEAIRVGQKVPNPTWSAAKRLAFALEASEKKGQKWPIRRAYLDRDGMASLRLQGDPHDEMLVRLGDGMWPQKMARAREALAFFEAAGRRASSLNLVSFSMPTWTPLAPRPQQKSQQSSQNTLAGAQSSSNASSADDASTPPTADNLEGNSEPEGQAANAAPTDDSPDASLGSEATSSLPPST